MLGNNPPKSRGWGLSGVGEFDGLMKAGKAQAATERKRESERENRKLLAPSKRYMKSV